MGPERSVEAGRTWEQIAGFVSTSRRRRFAGGMGGTAGSVGGNRLVPDGAVAGAAAVAAGAAARAVVPEERMELSWSACGVECHWIGLPLRGRTVGNRVLRPADGGIS